MLTTNMVKTCGICGDCGVVEAIVTCCECKSSREHLYCMRVFKTKPPTFWCCEECEQKRLVLPTKIVKEHEPEALRQNIPSLIQRTSPQQKFPRVLKGPNKNPPPGRSNFKEKRVNTGKTKYISCNEAVKLSLGENKSKCSPRKEFCCAHGSSKSMPPIRERTTVKSPRQERTPIKSTRKEKTANFQPHMQQPIVQQLTGPKENTVLPLQSGIDATPCIKSSRSVERTNTERERNTAKNGVLFPRKEEADIGRPTEVPESSTKPEKTNTDSAKSVVLSLSKEDSDIARHIEVSTSSKKLVKTETKPGSKNVADVEAGISDAGKPNLKSALVFSETKNPYNPSLQSYWKGSFYLPIGHEKFNDAFKAHPPLSVHYKVFETLMKMTESIYFELVPDHDVRMEVFLGDCPDKDDIGLYFFPRFKKRSENGISLIDFLWRENLVMKSYVLGVELLVLSSRVLQPQSQEFQGNYFLWGLFRPPKVSKKVADTQLMLEENRETCGDFPPGFKRICMRRD